MSVFMVSPGICLKCGNYINCNYFLKCVPANGFYEHCPGYFTHFKGPSINTDFSNVKKQVTDSRTHKSHSKKKTNNTRLDNTSLVDFKE